MSDVLEVRGGVSIRGDCVVPGDKSISHRALMFASIASGRSRVRGFLDGGDCRSTLSVVRDLGVRIEAVSATELVIEGRGQHGLVEPWRVLDCGNAGTAMRLFVGLLAGQGFNSVLVGSPQLVKRPMGRVVEPLRRMGARIVGRVGGGLAPLAIEGRTLRGIELDMTVASAQVKSCVLLAGMYAEGETTVIEPGPARDHTERMLHAMGVPVSTEGRTVRIRRPSEPLAPFDLLVPGDPSSAAFVAIAAAITSGSEVRVRRVCTNDTRIGFVRVLQRMGADLVIEGEHLSASEPVGDLVVRTSALRGTEVGGSEVATLIDEIPILAVAATQAVGRTVIRDAQELRVKETDRIATTVAELQRLGANIVATPDGLVVEGPTPLRGARVDSHGDHRLAMALTVAGCAASGTTTVVDAEVSVDSFPGFEDLMRQIGASLG